MGEHTRENEEKEAGDKEGKEASPVKPEPSDSASCLLRKPQTESFASTMTQSYDDFYFSHDKDFEQVRSSLSTSIASFFKQFFVIRKMSEDE